MVCLLVRHCLMSLILAMLLLTTSASFSLSMHDFLRIGGISFCLHRVPVCILPDRHADFGGDASDEYPP